MLRDLDGNLKSVSYLTFSKRTRAIILLKRCHIIQVRRGPLVVHNRWTAIRLSEENGSKTDTL